MRVAHRATEDRRYGLNRTTLRSECDEKEMAQGAFEVDTAVETNHCGLDVLNECKESGTKGCRVGHYGPKFDAAIERKMLREAQRAAELDTTVRSSTLRSRRLRNVR